VTFGGVWDWSTVKYAELSGGASVPATPSTAAGSGLIVMATGNSMAVAFLGLAGVAGQTFAHIHGPASISATGPVQVPLPVGE